MHVQTAVYSVYTVHIGPHWITQERQRYCRAHFGTAYFYNKTELHFFRLDSHSQLHLNGLIEIFGC